MATTAQLLQRFRQSDDYTKDMLVRDLIEYAQELEKRLKLIEARLTAGGL